MTKSDHSDQSLQPNSLWERALNRQVRPQMSNAAWLKAKPDCGLVLGWASASACRGSQLGAAALLQAQVPQSQRPPKHWLCEAASSQAAQRGTKSSQWLVRPQHSSRLPLDYRQCLQHQGRQLVCRVGSRAGKHTVGRAGGHVSNSTCR